MKMKITKKNGGDTRQDLFAGWKPALRYGGDSRQESFLQAGSLRCGDDNRMKQLKGLRAVRAI